MMNDSHNPIRGKTLARSLLVPVLILIVSIVAWWIVTRKQTPLPPVPVPPPVTPQPHPRPSHKEFYDAKIQPLLQKNRQANLEAAERCIVRIDDAFNKYRRGIRPFCNDITNIGTRFGVLTRMPLNWWYEDSRIQRFIQEKFEKHIFGEKQLNADLTSSLKTFRDEIHANRTALLASVKVAVSESDFPDIPIPDYEVFDKQLNAELNKFTSNRAKDSVYHGIATMITSEVAAYAVTQIITKVITTIGSSAASSAAVGGGATAGGAATGAGSGSLGGPVGTAIGLGVGVVVGVLVDWWMTESFKAKLESDLNQYLTNLHNGIVKGVDGQPGLHDALQQFCSDYNNAESMTMHRVLVGGA